MGKKIINEKSIEILFTRFLLASFDPGKIHFSAPTSIEERDKGYDAMFKKHSSFREVYLQFKSPEYEEVKKLFNFEITEHQHKRLKKYEPHSAYYVIPIINSAEEWDNAQLETKIPEDFLQKFACIDVGNLPYAKYVQFIPDYSRKEYERQIELNDWGEVDKSKRVKDYTITESDYFNGDVLVEKMKFNEIGSVHGVLKESDVTITLSDEIDCNETGSSILKGQLIFKWKS